MCVSGDPDVMHIAYFALLVREYDEAIRFFVDKLGFALLEDTDLGAGKRWVRVRPPGSSGCEVLLARASTSEQAECAGRQAGGRVFVFLHTDDVRRDYEAMRARGVSFKQAPRQEPYGTVAVFAGPYGNRWDLVELREGDQ